MLFSSNNQINFTNKNNEKDESNVKILENIELYNDDIINIIKEDENELDYFDKFEKIYNEYKEDNENKNNFLKDNINFNIIFHKILDTYENNNKINKNSIYFNQKSIINNEINDLLDIDKVIDKTSNCKTKIGLYFFQNYIKNTHNNLTYLKLLEKDILQFSNKVKNNNIKNIIFTYQNIENDIIKLFFKTENELKKLYKNFYFNSWYN